MAPRKFILVCHSGGKVVKSKDGSLSYTGGEAHAIDVNSHTQYDDLKLELAGMCNADIEGVSIKYFLPGNKRTLITVSNEKDLQRMIDFHEDSATADVYVGTKDSFDQHFVKNSGRRNQPVLTDPINHIAATSISPIPVNAQVVDRSPIATTAPAAAFIVATDGRSATPNLNVPVSSSATATRLSIVSADATAPAAAHGPTEDTASPIVASTCAIPIDIGNQRRTASVGANEVAIISIIDGVVQQGHCGSCKKDINGPTAVVPANDLVLQASCESKLITASVSDGNDVGLQDLVASWKNGIGDLGQNFSGVHEFRDVLRKYAIAHRFMYKFKKNDTDRVSVKCSVEGCSWRILAAWVSAEQSLKIKKMNKSHTCGVICTSIHSQATKHWLTGVVKDKLQDNPHYTPKAVISDIYRDFGIKLSYWQAWRGVELAKKQLQGPYKEVYNLLPGYCEKVLESNPGSITRFTAKDDLSFQRLFICYHASLHGFQNGFRPLLFLEAASLRSKHQEILLAAIAVDGEDGTFPIALAVVDIEDDDNWRWFLEQLKFVVPKSQSVTFVYDKKKGLSKPVQELFKNAHIGYCLHYLVEDFKRDLKGPFHGDRKGSLAGNFLAASHAPQPDQFRKCTESIRNVSPGAYDWVMKSEPECWAHSQFRGERYHQIKFDDIVSFKNWIIEGRELPMIEKLDMIRLKMMQLIDTRQEDSRKWSTKLTPSKEEKLQDESQKAHGLRVLISSTSVFEVHGDRTNVVNTDQCECSCRSWKLTGLPCSHAIAVFNYTGRNPYDYCSKYFMAETFRLSYSVPINTVIGNCDDNESSDKVQVRPPCRQNHPSKRGRKRKLPQSEEVNRRSFHCSKCKAVGHNKASCKTMV